jgi:hypothetical protein
VIFLGCFPGVWFILTDISEHSIWKTSKSSALKMAAIQECVTAVLRSIPKQAFADSFQKLCERCQPCVVKDGDCFEAQ